ncbi:MAG: HAD-IA family hydrolase [Solirubrobacteraceae bacterium]|nr:HAD-IA family hydrolase [Solirubrobacteraceae bacterium]
MSAAPGAVLLDALGTLVTFAPPAPRLRALLAERHGVGVTLDEAQAAMRAEIAHYRRHHDRAVDAASLAALRRECAAVLRDALPPAARDAVSADALVPTLLDAIAFSAYPEAAEVLDALRGRGHPLAVVSNWDVSLHGVLRDTGLAGRVDVVVTSAELGAAKPDPAPLRAALRALGAPAAGARHVGDTPSEDVAAARAAGVEPVLVVRDGAAPPPGVRAIRDLRGLLDAPAALR